MSITQPVPFELHEAEGVRVASNGTLRLSVFEPDAQLFKRRGISGIAMRNAADVLIPQLNQFCGELLKNPGTDAKDAVMRLMAIAGMVNTTEPVKHEWAVAKVGDVFVFTDGRDVIVGRNDMFPTG